MKPLIVLLMLPSMAFALSCEDKAAFANAVMTNVQLGKPFLEAYQSTKSMTEKERVFAKRVLFDAYGRRPGKTIPEREKIKQWFANKYAMECVKNE